MSAQLPSEPQEISSLRDILAKATIEEQIEIIKAKHMPFFGKDDNNTVVIWSLPYNFVLDNVNSLDPNYNLIRLIYERLPSDMMIYQDKDGAIQSLIHYSGRGWDLVGKRNLYLIRESNRRELERRMWFQSRYKKMYDELTSTKQRFKEQTCISDMHWATIEEAKDQIKKTKRKLVESNDVLTELRNKMDLLRMEINEMNNI